MIECLDTAIVNAFRQIICGFGGVALLPFSMGPFSRRRRGMGGGWLGNAYHCLVALGVMFHAFGQAIGCVLTCVPFECLSLFCPKGGRLGYGAYVMPGNARLAAIRIFIISQGPVWIGCGVIALLGWIMAGSDFCSAGTAAFGVVRPGAATDVRQVLSAAFGMFMDIVRDGGMKCH